MTPKPKRGTRATERPKSLDNPRVLQVTLTDDHLRRLDRIVEAGNFPSRSAAVRHWIEIESPVE
jgi:hypothetical protein